MELIIHRGTKEIGGSCIEIKANNTRLLIDFGMPLVNQDKEQFDAKILSDKSIEDLKDLKILPDIKGLYENEQKGIDAIFISHSHKDHYGLLNYANPEIPVYTSDGTQKLINVLNVFIRKENHIVICNPCTIQHKKTLEVGDFKITPYLMDHSGYDAMAFLIEEKYTGKRIFYSGDFRAGGWKKAIFEQFVNHPPKNIECLLMEGTMLEREGGRYQDEATVMGRMLEMLSKPDKNVTLAYCSAQNIDRIVTFYKAARRTQTTLVIDPYTATTLHVLKNKRNSIPQMDWRNIKVLIGNYYGSGDMYINKIVESAFKYLTFDFSKHKIKPWDIGKDGKYLVLMRDSMIPLIKKIPDINGARLIYSQWEGYVEDRDKAKKFWDFIENYNLTFEHVHTSGHATIDVLKRLKNALRPKQIIPIHTEQPEKFKDYFGKNIRQVKDGQVIEI